MQLLRTTPTYPRFTLLAPGLSISKRFTFSDSSWLPKALQCCKRNHQISTRLHVNDGYYNNIHLDSWTLGFSGWKYTSSHVQSLLILRSRADHHMAQSVRHPFAILYSIPHIYQSR